MNILNYPRSTTDTIAMTTGYKCKSNVRVYYKNVYCKNQQYHEGGAWASDANILVCGYNVPVKLTEPA